MVTMQNQNNTDYTGYDFWLTKLNQFNGDYVAAENGQSLYQFSRVPAKVRNAVKLYAKQPDKDLL
jgi:hypothetical protein